MSIPGDKKAARNLALKSQHLELNPWGFYCVGSAFPWDFSLKALQGLASINVFLLGALGQHRALLLCWEELWSLKHCPTKHPDKPSPRVQAMPRGTRGNPGIF